MPIDWNDKQKRKAFRRALQRVYPSYGALDMFVDEELDEALAEIVSEQNLKEVTYALIRWARSQGRLDELFEAFRQENPNDPSIAQLLAKPLTQAQKKTAIIDERAWEELFQCFVEDDLLELKRAMTVATQSVVKHEFQGVGLFDFAFDSVVAIRDRLEQLDNPQIAFHFVQGAIAELTRSSGVNGRDLTPLKQWHDCLAAEHTLSMSTTEVVLAKVGYLLVSVKEIGRSRKGVKEVMLYPELHVEGAGKLQDGMGPAKCKLSDIGKHLSQLIYQAEDVLIPSYCEEVTLELFLGWPQIEEHTANWDAEDRRGKFQKFKYQRYLLRSLDRFLTFDTQACLRAQLAKKWNWLETCVNNSEPYKRFYFKSGCPESGQLTAALSRKAGLKLVGLPEMPDDRESVFYNIIDSAVPVALWLESAPGSAEEISQALDDIFQNTCLTQFGSVAECLLQHRAEDHAIAGELRALFDCPDRWPKSILKPAASSSARSAAQSAAQLAETFDDDEDAIVSPF